MGDDGTMIAISAGRTGLVWGVGDDGRLHQVAFGAEVADRRPDLPIGLHPLAYPTFGEEPLRDPALRITHADGVQSTRLRYVRHTEEPAAEGGGTVHRVELVDRVAPLSVTLTVRTWPAHHVLEQWVAVTNRSEAPITVHRAAGSAPAFAGAAPHLTHWGGGWAGEWTETTERLSAGTKTVASAGGVRPSLYRPAIVLLAPAGPAEETVGSVGACTVAWGGDVRFDAEVFLHGHLRLIAGHQDRGAEWVLDPDETFTSPSVLWTWSNHGIGATSRALHGFVRDQAVRDGHRARATVVNTWEAVGFSLDPDGLADQVDRAADLGAELFLLDDGWFGTTHPRNDDTTSLGDWDVDRRKLPAGLGPLVARTLERGMRFGLWVEPEMVNPVSDLYRRHPEWVIGEPGRDRREERQQLVLDLCRPDVGAFVVDTIDRILAEHPGITYLKWDANRDVTEPGSTALPADRQSHLSLDRVSATWEVMAEVARRHPDVELMLCASGGGRADVGTLRWFHELWTSDNTDPVDRVRIQWGASHLLPASVLAAHVTRWGNRPVAFGCAVAMSGRFGFDLDLRRLDPEEWATCRQAVVDHRAIRDLVQQGELHRLVSPVGSDRAALGYLDPVSGRSVVFAFVLPADPAAASGATSATGAGAGGGATPVGPIALPWLDPSGRYDVVDRTPGGADPVHLTDATLAWPIGDGPAARVVEIIPRP